MEEPDEEQLDELVKLNITYDLAGKNPIEAGKIVRKTLKQMLQSGEIDGLTGENATVDKSFVGEKWELEMETGSDGVDCPVVLHVCGVKADEQPFLLKQDTSKDKTRPPFKPRQVDTFEILIDDFIGDIFKLRFGFPPDVANAKWHLKSLKLWHPKHNDMYKTDCELKVIVSPYVDSWREVYVIWPDYPLLPVIDYIVTVFTSPKSGQMDCGVDIILEGDHGNSGRRKLKKMTNNKLKFKPGQVDIFEVPVVKLGRVLRCHVFNDLTSPNRTWLLDKVVVKESEQASENAIWKFPCQRYFDPEKGDEQADRILELNKAPPPEPKEPEPIKVTPKKSPTPSQRSVAVPVQTIPVKQVKKPTSLAIPNAIPNDQWEIWWENRKNQSTSKDVTVTFIVVGDQSESNEIPMVVELKPGVSNRRKISGVDPGSIGDLQKVRIRFGDQVKQATKWDIAKLHIKHLASNETSTFEFERAIVQKVNSDSTIVSDNSIEASNGGFVPVRTYVCELYNGNRTGLLEKGCVYLILRGQRGTTGKRWIVNTAEGHLPLKGKDQVIIYELQCVDLGKIKGIRFGHDKRGKDASYYLEKIIVRPTHLADLEYVFEFGSLTKDEEVQATFEIPKSSTPRETERLDPNEWVLWWKSEPDQTFDFLQISLTLVGVKGQSTYLVDVEIGPGDSSAYKIKLNEEIGELKSVRLKHGPKVNGKHPPWRVVEMCLQNRATGQLFKFKPPPMVVPPPAQPIEPVQTTLAPSPHREALVETISQSKNSPDPQRFYYRVEVFTSVSSVPLTTSARQPELYIKFIGEYYTSEPCWFGRSLTNPVAFKPGQFDAFELALDDDVGPVENVRLGLGKKALNSQAALSGIVIEKVIVKPLHTPGIEYTFNTGVGSISQREAVEWLISWVCADSQANIRATVSLVLYGGGRKRSSEVSTTTTLRPGPSEELRCEFNDRADDDVDFLPYKVRVGFLDNKQLGGPVKWDIIYVRLRCRETQKLFTFTLTKGPVILSDERDGWREIPADAAPNKKGPSIIDYQLDIFTSQEIHSPPDAKIFVNIKGRRGDFGIRKLKRSLNNGFQNFHPGRMDTFRVEAVDLGEIRSLIIGHDETGRNQSWHCERINLLNRRTGEIYEFIARCWFDRKMADGTVQRRLRPYGVALPPPISRKWLVSITVAKAANAGTKAALGFVICGRTNSSNIIHLTMGGDGFAPGEIYEFTINVELDDVDETIGEVVKVRLGFPDWSSNPAILIDNVTLKELATGAQYTAVVREWVWATAKHDGWREFFAEGNSLPKLEVVKYQITTWTGPEMQADTDCDVYLEIEGTYGRSGKRRLASSLAHIKQFASPSQMDLFDLEAIDLGEIHQISVTLAPEEQSDRNNWHLSRALILKHPMGSEEYLFECNCWFDNAAHSHSFQPKSHQRRASLAGLNSANNYLVFVTTGPERDMAKSANVVFELFGEFGMFGPFLLNRPSPSDGREPDPREAAFQPGLVDAFPIAVDEAAVGRFVKIRLQNVGANPSWFVDKLALYDVRRPRVETKHFEVFDWLSADYGDGDSVKEFPVEYVRMPSLQSEYYSVEIENGLNGTPMLFQGVVTCYIEMFGKTPLSSGIRPLRKNMDRNGLYEPGTINVFTFSAVGVGDVTRIKIGHTAMDASFRWHVVKVTVAWGDKQQTFPCNMILAKLRGDDTTPVEVTLGE